MSQLDRAEPWQPELNQGSAPAVCADVKRAQFKSGLCGYGGGTVCVCAATGAPHQSTAAAWAALALLCCLLV